MTHTAHPYGQRIGIIRGWSSSWFAKNGKKYRRFLQEDYILRKFLEKALMWKSVSSISIDRGKEEAISITIVTGKPGLIIGKDGEGITKLTKNLKNLMKKNNFSAVENLKVKVEEIRFVETSARIIAEQIAESLKKRMSFRRVLKQTADKIIANREIKGVKISLSGRLDGAEIARHEIIRKGNVPLQTLRADIDYAEHPATLPYGVIGIKVWIYKGEIYKNNK